jgi:AcrR family transcriptional regulator
MATTGLRERKKEAVRQSLHEATLRLVVEQGLENVTVEAIADAALVSRRTFSNYFSSKEEALFHRDALRASTFLELLHARPATEDPLVALTRATQELAAIGGELDPDWLARRRALRGRPELAGHRAAMYAANERALAAEIGRRLPDDASRDLRARILSATYLAALRIAGDHWFDAPERPLHEVVAEALRYTR